MADEEIMDTPVTAAQMAALISAGTVRTTALRMTPREWLMYGHLHIGSNGTPVWNSAGGVNTVTEASGTNISNAAVQTAVATAVDKSSISNWAYSDTAGGVQLHRRIGRATATTAGGAFANLSLVGAHASAYYGVCKIIGVIAQNATAAGTLTFESPAGTAALPSVFVNAYAANVINKELEDVVITHATLVDQQAIVVDGAGFGAGDVTIIYEYWYET